MPSEGPLLALDVALRVARALEAVGAEYFVGGSVASSLQGEPRATNDIDFVVSMSAGKVPALVAQLGPDFEVDADMLREALRTATTANLFYMPLITKIDVFGLGTTAFDETEFARRRRVRVKSSGEELFVKSPEDTVLRKLLWYREGGGVSEKQWRDVVEVLRVSGPGMDGSYLDAWAARLHLEALLARARGDALAPRPG